ncbi:helix-turn-helix transcriptional regulator [Paracraurococcus ruber]|nr:LuxR family transcriptional regulator [Paracraurococcus ruber]
MPLFSTRVLDLIEGCHDQPSAAGVGAAFLHRLGAYGVQALNARAYRTAAELGTMGHVYARAAPAAYDGLYADPRFYRFNPIPREMERSIAPKRWTAMAWPGKGGQWLLRAMREHPCPDGLAIPCHGPGGYLGVVSLGFERLESLAPEEERAIALAAIALHARMRDLSPVRARAPGPQLTERERDCLGFVAEGWSDARIAARLGIGTATVATHVVNARRKLGARTRSQAVAQFLLHGL